ncbi:MAG: N-acetylmuramidase [Hyphomicrobiaceae bacterium]|nr:MAG: N-acetylmuramidase [Hyphomicrobiaceae bacterium]
MADFNPAYEQLIKAEGGYKLHKVKNDRGGLTYAGITRKSYPDWSGWAYIDRGETPPNALVRAFYHAQYWLRYRLDEVANQDVAECVFMAGVNAEAAIRLLQIVVKTKPDGRIGPNTLSAVNAADPQILLSFFTLAKIDRYRQIVNKDRSQEMFLLGWINRAFTEAQVG